MQPETNYKNPCGSPLKKLPYIGTAGKISEWAVEEELEGKERKGYIGELAVREVDEPGGARSLRKRKI
ncbi:MAG TPA: hypothetical protein EYP17_07350 [Candidatus Latescibacteria bacterium]|nr:hypothetical protein [Candidatus Latescibacterota bacterium]